MYLKLLQFVHGKETNSGENEWVHYQEMKFFLPYVEECLKYFDDCQSYSSENEVDGDVNMSVESPGSKDPEFEETHDHITLESNESQVNSDNESVAPGGKPVRMYKFKLDDVDLKLIAEVQKYPFLYETTEREDKTAKTKKWLEIAQVVYEKEYVETNPMAG